MVEFQLGMRVRLYWEHQILDQLKNDEEFSDYYNDEERWSSLYYGIGDPRNGLYGENYVLLIAERSNARARGCFNRAYN